MSVLILAVVIGSAMGWYIAPGSIDHFTSN